MDLQQLKEIVFQDFINDAKSAFYSWEKLNRGKGYSESDKDWKLPANTFGGCFAKLPDCISFYSLRDLIDDFEEN